MSNHTTGTSPLPIVEPMSMAQSKFLTWYKSQHLADVNRDQHNYCEHLADVNRDLHGYCEHCDQLECNHSFDEVWAEYLTANPTALRQEDPL